jgi:Ca2+-binding EF-hand superfamily protein
MVKQINAYLKTVWAKYDEDHSGKLSKDEMKRLVQETMEETGQAESFDEE